MFACLNLVCFAAIVFLSSIKEQSIAFTVNSSRFTRYSGRHTLNKQCRMSAGDPTSFDVIIDELLNTSRLADAVAKNVKQIAQPGFFLRVAERADMANNFSKRSLYDKMASDVTVVLQDLLQLVEKKMDRSQSITEVIVSSCAEPNSGEFLLPLSEERYACLKDCVQRNFAECKDPAFLSTVQSWVKKSSSDGLDGMVIVLQKVMQVYSSESIKDILPFPDQHSSTSALFLRLLEADADSWDTILYQGMSTNTENAVSKEALLGAIQTAVEGAVLTKDNGSLTQQVLAQYLAEMATRIEFVSNSMQ